MDTDRNLLFGVLALQADLIDNAQFAEACTAWTARKNESLADLLVERRWISESDRTDIERLLERKLKKHRGDPLASLAAVADDGVRRVLAVLGDAAVEKTLAQLPQHGSHVLLSSLPFNLETRERYTLSRLHASGGIGRVWLARDDDLGREVALKELRPEQSSSPAVWQRFLEEARITGQLEHPGIVPVYELARRSDNQQPFYTMRFIRGRTLTEAVRDYHEKLALGKAGALDLRKLLSALISICNAVAYAHARGVIHRDLKGQNVILGDFGEVILLDWGLAKLIDQPEKSLDLPPVVLHESQERDATLLGQVLGTPAHMAPEQAQGRLDLLGPATDVYGLGTLLYEILAGRAPFTGSDTQEVLRKVREEEPALPQEIAVAVPPALEAICLRAMAKRPSDRYARAGDLAREVQHWLADEPVDAYPEPWRARAHRWLGRHRTLVASTAGLVLAAAVMLAVVAVFLRQATAREAALRARAEQNLALAERNFQLARDAVDKGFTKVSASEPLKAHGLERVRQDLLRQAKDFYEAFLQEQIDDPVVRAERGRAYVRLAAITRVLGSNREAIAFCEQARTILEPLAGDQPQVLDYQEALARALQELGILYALVGRSGEGEPVLKQAVALAQRLVDEQNENATYQELLCHISMEMGRLYQGRGNPASARAAYEKVLPLGEQLLRNHPDASEYQHEVANIYHELGLISHENLEYDRAQALYEKALPLEDRLVRDHPDQPSHQDQLGRTLLNLGNVFRSMGRPDLARSTYMRAMPVRERLVQEHPDVPTYQDQLAWVLESLGRVVQDTEAQAALQLFEKTLPVRERLVREHADVPAYQDRLARLLGTLGARYQAGGQLARAEDFFQRSLRVCEQVAHAHPDVPAYQYQLAGEFMDLGALYTDTERFAEAQAVYERGLSLAERLAREHRDNVGYQERLANFRLSLASTRAHRGAYKEAIGEAQAELARRPSPSGVLLYSAACVYAVSSRTVRQDTSVKPAEREKLASRYADQAMALLLRAQAAKYFLGGGLSDLKRDRDMDPLRARADFQKLLAEAERQARQAE
jgi:eukaryotic-like serine/threonine-protein kinase